MPTDKELYLEWKLEYPHLTASEAAEMLSVNHTLNYDSLRGRLSRASRDKGIALALYEQQREVIQNIPPSVQTQKRIINNSLREWQEFQSVDTTRTALFVSDAHMPYMRVDAFNLMLEVAYSVQPDVITALNDALDNKGFGLHGDSEAVYKQVWRGDFANALQMQTNYHNALRSTLREGGKLVGLMGNHDAWIYKHWRSNSPQSAELNIAQYMHRLYQEGVLVFSRGEQNVIHLSSGLAFVHGLSTAALPTTLAKKGFAHFMQNGIVKSWVQGHTHRPMIVDGGSLGYKGVTFANSGHLRNNDPEWMTHKAQKWGMGVVVCKYNPLKWEHDITLVEFVERNNILQAKYEGRTFTVPLNDSRPEYML